MSFVHQQARAADFIVSEANGQRSRANIVMAAGFGVVLAGTLIAQTTADNAAIATPTAGNTGNGVLGTFVVTSGAVSGNYSVQITEASAGGGAFEVTGPGGVVLGAGEVGTPFTAGGLTFTIADGASDFVVGDSWTIAVTANLGEWVPYDEDGANDGRRAAGGVLYASVDTTQADVQAVGIVRDAEVAAALLIGLDAAGRTDLAALGVLVRD
ncbi:head decoration protein [Verticiella sediminum]|uniref:Head decoration protein n=1 Tax=Verticiella sediminum TaxID=1247510 RepID=A0A556AIC5_9BURK|nr:head decoration protein [Verticiella sediminum]TSH92631.1 head decoration protein [Verticiella sediminum]